MNSGRLKLLSFLGLILYLGACSPVNNNPNAASTSLANTAKVALSPPGSIGGCTANLIVNGQNYPLGTLTSSDVATTLSHQSLNNRGITYEGYIYRGRPMCPFGPDVVMDVVYVSRFWVQ